MPSLTSTLLLDPSMYEVSILGASRFQSAQYRLLLEEGLESGQIYKLKAQSVCVKVYTPGGRISDDSARVDETGVYDGATHGPVQRGNLDAILHGVGPEHSSAQVVDGDALWASQVCH